MFSITITHAFAAISLNGNGPVRRVRRAHQARRRRAEIERLFFALYVAPRERLSASDCATQSGSIKP